MVSLSTGPLIRQKWFLSLTKNIDYSEQSTQINNLFFEFETLFNVRFLVMPDHAEDLSAGPIL